MLEYSDAPEVETIAEKLIPKWHDHLEGLDIRYVFRSEAATKNGRVIMGKARRIGGLNAFLAGSNGPFLVMEIAADQWKTLNRGQREALVDHELEHFKIDQENGQTYIHGHDVEEFHVVVSRHGLWMPQVETFVQCALPFVEESKPGDD